MSSMKKIQIRVLQVRSLDIQILKPLLAWLRWYLRSFRWRELPPSWNCLGLSDLPTLYYKLINLNDRLQIKNWQYHFVTNSTVSYLCKFLTSQPMIFSSDLDVTFGVGCFFKYFFFNYCFFYANPFFFVFL